MICPREYRSLNSWGETAWLIECSVIYGPVALLWGMAIFGWGR